MTQWGKLSLQIAVLVAATYCLVHELSPHTRVLAKDNRSALIPDWFGDNVRVLEMDETGKPKREFRADKILHYQDHDMTDLFNPHFTLFSTSNPPWHLQGEKGRTFHGNRTTDIERIDLWHHVTLWQGNETHSTTMTTSTIAIFPEKDFAQTDQAVAMEQPGQRLTGVGLKAYFDSQSVELLSQVRSEHAQRLGG